VLFMCKVNKVDWLQVEIKETAAMLK